MNPDWQAIFESADTLEKWNSVVLPLMLDQLSGTMEFKRQAHAVARGRGYEYVSTLGHYRMAWVMLPVRYGKNLVSVGAHENVLRVGYQRKDGITYYRYSGVENAAEWAISLLRNPFPDAIFRKWVKKFKWEWECE